TLLTAFFGFLEHARQEVGCPLQFSGLGFADRRLHSRSSLFKQGCGFCSRLVHVIEGRCKTFLRSGEQTSVLQSREGLVCFFLVCSRFPLRRFGLLLGYNRARDALPGV